ncbi:MAPK regulated corepressor interacting protein 2 [Camelus dromedarius]|uniref:MAPK regulated corepressor interacting protein 2 n=1 Tax=Camelus dromedarius TaxID=9838 RepID=A0A5N4C613_CAMDR|nr:MAPK regulated corepressor interacting protein 2 [Camelus dromedarius]
MNGRRPPAPSPSLEGTQETHTLAHEENGRFVSRAWQQMEQQLGGGPAGESGLAPVQSVERMPNSRLHNPVPIDLVSEPTEDRSCVVFTFVSAAHTQLSDTE